MASCSCARSVAIRHGPCGARAMPATGRAYGGSESILARADPPVATALHPVGPRESCLAWGRDAGGREGPCALRLQGGCNGHPCPMTRGAGPLAPLYSSTAQTHARNQRTKSLRSFFEKKEPKKLYRQLRCLSGPQDHKHPHRPLPRPRSRCSLSENSREKTTPQPAAPPPVFRSIRLWITQWITCETAVENLWKNQDLSTIARTPQFLSTDNSPILHKLSTANRPPIHIFFLALNPCWCYPLGVLLWLLQHTFSTNSQDLLLLLFWTDPQEEHNRAGN